MSRGGVGDDPVVGTYFSVRLVLPVLAGFITVATVLESVVSGHVRPSISDYYQGPVRDVFVGGLVAIAACLVAYRGDSRLEDSVLNFAGFNAVVVALVPDNFTEVLASAPAGVVAGDVVVARSQVVTNLQISLGAFLLAALLLLVVDRRLTAGGGRRWRGSTALARWLVRLAWVGETVLVVVVLAVVVRAGSVAGVSLYRVAHFGAASLLILFLSFAVASHGWPVRLRPETWAAAPAGGSRTPYRVIAVAMWAGLAVGVTAILVGVPYAVIATEYSQLALFVAFWVLATRRAWRALPRC